MPRVPKPASPSDRVPKPPSPAGRRQPLPEEKPKPPQEDPLASRRLAAIMASPSYRRADADPEFLSRGDVRGVRLLLDYLKTERILEQSGVKHTIVVFGGSRIAEPVGAERKLAEATAALEVDGDSPELARQVRVAERLAAKSHFYDVAREFGRLVAASNVGLGNERVVVATGGGPGIMEAANRGAFDVGAKSIGLNITLPHEQFPNPYLTPELAFQFHYFAMRKLHFLLRAKALVAFPGGYGTFDEVFEVLTLVQTRTINPIPVVLVGEEFWKTAVDFDYLVDEGLIDPEDRELFWFAEEAEEIWNGILAWYEKMGTPLKAVT
jgi:uncharacterized protein (TIGR00730 family)